MLTLLQISIFVWPPQQLNHLVQLSHRKAHTFALFSSARGQLLDFDLNREIVSHNVALVQNNISHLRVFYIYRRLLIAVSDKTVCLFLIWKPVKIHMEVNRVNMDRVSSSASCEYVALTIELAHTTVTHDHRFCRPICFSFLFQFPTVTNNAPVKCSSNRSQSVFQPQPKYNRKLKFSLFLWLDLNGHGHRLYAFQIVIWFFILANIYCFHLDHDVIGQNVRLPWFHFGETKKYFRYILFVSCPWGCQRYVVLFFGFSLL